MENFALFSDSACDLSQELLDREHIRIIPYYVTFDKKQYVKERAEISNAEFYRRLRSRQGFPSTSLPPVSDYEDAFRPALEKGQDVLCVCLTSKFSGSCQSAVDAAGSLREEFPGRRVAVVDSILASGAQGLLLLEIARMRAAGLSFDAILANVEKIKNTGRAFVTVNTLEYLQRGGRIGLVSSLAGNILDIKPIIVLKDGELNPVGRVRGRRAAVRRVIELSFKYIESMGGDKDRFACCVLQSDCGPEADVITETLIKAGIRPDIPVQELGATIGSHIGATVLGICLLRKYETM